MPRHCLMFDGFRPNEYRSGTCAGADDGYVCNAQPTCTLYPFAPPFLCNGWKIGFVCLIASPLRRDGRDRSEHVVLRSQGQEKYP